MNPLHIDIKGTDSTNTKINAIVNVLNIITQEIYEGRVLQAQNDIIQNKTKTEYDLLQIQADIVESVVDEYNSVIGG